MEQKVIQNMPIDRLVCEPQVREGFDEESLVGLAHCIKEVGLLQPILVRRDGNRFVVVDGERRLWACRKAGLKEVAVIIDDRELGVVEVTMRQLVANTQRVDLTPIERARAYARLIEESGWSAAEVARRTGFSQGQVSKLTTLLRLPSEVLDRVESGEIPAGTAYQIAIAGDGETQSRLADEAANGGLTREAVVERARQHRSGRTRRKPRRTRNANARVVLPLGEGRSVAVVGPDLTLHTLIEWLQALLNRIKELEPQGVDLVDVVKILTLNSS